MKGPYVRKVQGRGFLDLGPRFVLTLCPLLFGHLRDLFIRVRPGNGEPERNVKERLWKRAILSIGSPSGNLEVGSFTGDFDRE